MFKIHKSFYKRYSNLRPNKYLLLINPHLSQIHSKIVTIAQLLKCSISITLYSQIFTTNQIRLLQYRTLSLIKIILWLTHLKIVSIVIKILLPIIKVNKSSNMYHFMISYKKWTQINLKIQKKRAVETLQCL